MKYSNDNSLSCGRIGTTAVTLLCTVLAGPTLAQNRFGDVTPGGVQPNLERKTLPQQSKQPEYAIPAVPDRPLGESDGPRLVVQRFQLEGVDDIAGTNISQQTISTMLEDIRRNHPEGFTIGELQGVANEITRFYRQNGLILALAIVPQQEINEGVVTIAVLQGELGQVTTANNTRYSDDLIKAPLAELIGEPVQAAQIEGALLRVNDIPGLEVAGVFHPGKNIGETALVVNAKQETPLEYSVIADDYGVETTGEQRLIAGVTWNNPLGFGDKLAVTALQTFDPEDSTYGAINYQSQLWNPKLFGGIAYSINDYAISQSLNVVGIEGKTRITSVYGKYVHTRGRRLNITGVFDISTKRAKVDLEDINFSFGEDKLTVVSVGLDVETVDNGFGGGINEMHVYYHQGIADFLGSMDKNGDNDSLRLDSNGDYVGGDFNKLSFNLSRLQLIDPNNVLLLRLQGQYTDDLLSSIEQFAMGGPNSVRAYPVSEYIRDKGIFASAEWIINAPGFSDKPAFNGRTWGEVFTVSVFVDYADGRSNDNLPFNQNREQDISGVGIGLQLKPTDASYFKFEAATPTTSEDPSNDDDPQLWFSAGIDF